jgi:tRNA modification GTPase
MHTEDVILAIASPPGRSARGIVRLSGDRAPDVAALLLADPAPLAGRGVRRGDVELRGAALPCLVACFPGKRTYTGEPVVEVQVPGNPVLLERLLETALARAAAAGIPARRAEPGEFTARAFFSGRLTLPEAEGVAATIAAESDAQLRAARLLSSGALGRRARAVADELAAALALVEAGIDFTDEEDVVAITPRDLADRLEPVRRVIADQLEHAVGMEQLEAIPRVVLSGPPNAGKSTLFNALLGRDRAVVTSRPGATRDVLAEPLSIPLAHGTGEVMLIDVAGDEAAVSRLGRQMQEAAAGARRGADLLLECRGPGTPLPPPAPGALGVRTMSDLPPAPDPGGPAVCATSGAGLDALRAAIAERLATRAVSLAADAVVLQPRHEAALRSAAGHLEETAALLGPQRGRPALADPEIVAATMRAALDELSAVAGDVTPDDVLGRIFASFCIGK